MKNTILSELKLVSSFIKSLKWSDQRGVANNKIIKSSAIWLIIFPIAARAISSVKEFVDLTLFGETIKITTSLPFSWQILFFAACSFTLAGIIYSIFCPNIIKDYKSFTEFNADGKSRMQIHDFLKSVVLNSNKEIIERYKETLNLYLNRFTDTVNIVQKGETKVISTLNDMTLNKGKNSNAFYYVVYVANEHNRLAIKLSMLFYMIGFILIGVLAIENISYVLGSIS